MAEPIIDTSLVLPSRGMAPPKSQDVAFMQSQLNSSVEIVEFQVDDLWMRDTSCIFAYSDCSNYTDCVERCGWSQKKGFVHIRSAQQICKART